MLWADKRIEDPFLSPLHSNRRYLDHLREGGVKAGGLSVYKREGFHGALRVVLLSFLTRQPYLPTPPKAAFGEWGAQLRLRRVKGRRSICDPETETH